VDRNDFIELGRVFDDLPEKSLLEFQLGFEFVVVIGAHNFFSVILELETLVLLDVLSIFSYKFIVVTFKQLFGLQTSCLTIFLNLFTNLVIPIFGLLIQFSFRLIDEVLVPILKNFL